MITETKTIKTRLFYLDYLRVFSSFAIILLHIAAANMNNTSVSGFEWNVFNFYNSLVRWAVPVFIMISGALFLPREFDTKQLYSKYILRMFISYVVWSIFYAVVTPIGKFVVDNSYVISVSEILKNAVTGAMHMWFIPMIIGLYMCIPLIKPLIKNKSTVKYFLILAFVFVFLRTTIANISNDFFSPSVASGIECINSVIGSVNLVFGYVPYFILGYVLNETETDSKKRSVIYILGVLGFLMTVLLNALASIKANTTLETYYGINTLNIALMAMAVFVWFKYNVRGKDPLNKIIVKLSKYSFGTYLVHIFILMVFGVLGFETTTFNPILSVPVISIIAAVISFFISFVINQIPFLKKYIV